jgi:hypothetical protein
VWLFLPGTLGAHTSFISELSPVLVQCEWGYIWHTAGRGANGLSSLKQKAKKKVVMKSSHTQVGSVCTGEDERDLNLGVISRCFSSRQRGLARAGFPRPRLLLWGGVCDEFSDAARGNLAPASPASHPRSVSPVPVCPACFAP